MGAAKPLVGALYAGPIGKTQPPPRQPWHPWTSECPLVAPLAFLHGTRHAYVGMQSGCALHIICVLTEVHRELHLQLLMCQLENDFSTKSHTPEVPTDYQNQTTIRNVSLDEKNSQPLLHG